MKTKLIALILICALLLCGVCAAEQNRPRLDTAELIVYRITNGNYRIMNAEGRFAGEESEDFPSDQIGESAVLMEHGCYGYVANDGSVLIEPDYKNLPVFEDGYAVVCKKDIDAVRMEDFSGVIGFPDIYGVIDAYGDVVVPIKYSDVQICTGGEYAILGEEDDEENYSIYGIFDLAGKNILLEPKYRFIDDPHGGVCIACVCQKSEGTPIVNDSGSGSEYVYKYGIINVRGDVLVPFDYERIEYNVGFNAYTCYNNDEIEKIYEVQNGTVVEKES